MNTRDLIHFLYGPEGNQMSERLASVKDDLIARHEAREKAALEAADIRQAVASHGHHLAHAEELLVQANKEALVESNLPFISTYDACQIFRQVAKQNPDDQGAKIAAHTFYNRYLSDPEGAVSVGEMTGQRDYIKDRYPKSAAVKAFDREAIDASYGSLGNLNYLSRLASEVHDQESYERVVRQAGLDGDSYVDVRARSWIRAYAEVQADNFQPVEYKGFAGVLDAAAQKLAQMDEEIRLEFEDDNEELPEIDYDSVEEEPSHDEVHDEMEEEFPHDEMSEELAEVVSPITGEPLVLELGIADDDGAEFDDLEMEDDVPPVDPGTDNLPDFSNFDVSAAEMSQTTVVDPTSGQELLVTLEPVEDEAVEEDENVEDVEPVSDEADDGADMPSTDLMSEESKDLPAVTAAQKKEKQLKLDIKPSGRSQVENDKSVPNAAKMLGLKKAVKLSKEAVLKICASMGLTASSIEESVLSGEAVAVGNFMLRANDMDGLEIHRLAAPDTDVGSKVLRSGGISEFDAMVSDFMALSASQHAPRSLVKAQLEKKISCVLTTQVPGDERNARRIMAKIWDIIPTAEGSVEDGVLEIKIAEATKRELNRVQKIMTDVFGVKSITASAYVGDTPAPRAPAGQPQAPMQAPMQTAATGTQVQKNFIKEHLENPLKAKAEGECKECDDGKCASCVKASKSAQMIPDPDHLEEMGVGEPGLDEPGLDDLGAPGLDGMEELPGPHSDPMPMTPDMVGPAMGGGMDAGNPLLSPSQLEAQDEEAIRAAMEHYRNQNMDPLTGALKQFTSDYKSLLDKYGEPGTPSRAMAEAAVIRLMTEAWEKPAIISPVTAGLRQADFATPAISGKPGPKVPGMSMTFRTPEMPNIPVNTAPKVMKGKKPSTDVDVGDHESHSWAPSIGTSGEAQVRNKGKKLKVDTDIGTWGDEPSEFGKTMDSLAKSAPSSVRSKSVFTKKKK